MGKYPTEITDATLAKNVHISDDQIRRDIADTEAEIEKYKALMGAELVTAIHHEDAGTRRMADFSAGARPLQIAERQEFVDFLNLLLAARATPTAEVRGSTNSLREG